MENYLNELNGYLRCLSTLCGPRYAFGARTYPASTNIDTLIECELKQWGKGSEYVPATEFQFHGKRPVIYKDLLAQIEQFISSGMLSKKHFPNEQVLNDTKRMLLENLNEYYGLISTDLNIDGLFHPLIRSPVHQFDITSNRHQNILMFMVKIEDCYVLTCFLRKIAPSVGP